IRIENRERAARAIQRLREIALLLSRRGNARLPRQLARIVVALERRREEGTVAPVIEFRNEDRTAGGITPLMVSHGRLVQAQPVIGPTVGVEVPPALVSVDCAMQLVGPA